MVNFFTLYLYEKLFVEFHFGRIKRKKKRKPMKHISIGANFGYRILSELIGTEGFCLFQERLIWLPLLPSFPEQQVCN